MHIRLVEIRKCKDKNEREPELESKSEPEASAILRKGELIDELTKTLS